MQHWMIKSMTFLCRVDDDDDVGADEKEEDDNDDDDGTFDASTE